MNNEKIVRTRFAPSPTGSLHIGGIRTAMYCYAWARKNKGQYIVRVEDTDQNRFVEGATDEIFEMLAAYKLDPDESLKHGGSYGPYLQSERTALYKKYAQELIDKGYAYYCFLVGDELKQLQEQYKGTGFRSPYREQPLEKSLEMINEGKPYVIRLKVPNNEFIDYVDGVQGKIRFDTNNVGDEILIKTNGFGSYHLAVVVDDHLMEISHVFRAVEWLPSTPKQILLYRYLGWEMPPFYHVTAILDPEGGKLSKRKGSVAAKDFLKEGYLPEAILNFLMFLGWSSPEKRAFGEKEREIYSLNQFVELFDVKDFNHSNPVFNREKLLWFSKEYIKAKSGDELATIFIDWLTNYAEDKSILEKVQNDQSLAEKLNLVKERSSLLKEIPAQIRFFYEMPKEINWNIKQLSVVGDQLSEVKTKILELHMDLPEDANSWTHEAWENGMRQIATDMNLKAGDVFMVLRVAVVGEPFSPPLFEALQILGKEETIRRLKN